MSQLLQVSLQRLSRTDLTLLIALSGATRLRLAITQDSQGKSEFLLLSPQRNIQVVDAFPQEWISKHGRHIGKSTVIHHLLLDYCITIRIGPEQAI